MPARKMLWQVVLPRYAPDRQGFLQISGGKPPETELFFELMKFFSEPAKTEDFVAALQKVAADDYFPSFAVPSYLTAKEGTEFSESCFCRRL